MDFSLKNKENSRNIYEVWKHLWFRAKIRFLPISSRGDVSSMACWALFGHQKERWPKKTKNLWMRHHKYMDNFPVPSLSYLLVLSWIHKWLFSNNKRTWLHRRWCLSSWWKLQRLVFIFQILEIWRILNFWIPII